MNNNRFTRLKICGIRSSEEIEELKDLPVNYFGCIFVSKSPRFVSNELAKKITEIAHSAEKKTVGVFLDEKIENIINIIKKTDIDTVQLHGGETPEYCEELYLKLEEYEKKIKELSAEIGEATTNSSDTKASTETTTPKDNQTKEKSER